jgi:hypothetical protein
LSSGWRSCSIVNKISRQFSKIRLNAYEQTKGDPKLNCDPAKGTVRSPLLLWGPYLWADGKTPRKSDGLVWLREDLAADGTHPSDTNGTVKVARLLLNFFRTDPLARTWYLSPDALKKVSRAD